VPEPTLDERFLELRRSVDREIACARNEAIAEIAHAFARMRRASNPAEWSAAVEQAKEKLGRHPNALSLIDELAALTKPAAADLREAGARRFAKVKIAEIQLYQAQAVTSGRAARNLYGALQPQIDAAREAFKQAYLDTHINNGSAVADYLHTEIVRTLANDDATLLGPEYPGPMA
jgi:hypothetical protein